MSVLRQQLDDRVGDVRGVGRGPPFVADGAEGLAGGPRRARRRRGCGSGSRGRATRTARPCGRSRTRRRVARRTPRRRAARPPASTRRTGCPARSDRSAATAGRPRHSPLKTSLVETISRSVPALGAGRGQDAGRLAVAPDRQLRIERAAVDIGPGRGVDDDLGPVTVEARPDPVRRVEVEGVAVPGDRAGRAGERRVGEGGDRARSRDGRPPR